MVGGDPNFSRRQFVGSLAVGAGALAVGKMASGSAASTPRSFKGNEIVDLGKTGIKASRLAQGTGYNGYNRSSAHTRAGKAAFDKLLRHSLDQGVNFIDMADLYGSHPFVRDVVKSLPREKYVLLSKIWPRKADWVTPSGGAKEEIDRFRKELDAEMIDVCLIHCMTNDQWPTEFARIRDELSSLKDKGVVRAVGVSCHDFGALKVAAEHPWVEVIFARINHKGGKQFACDASVEEVSETLRVARRNGKCVVGMKIFGAGKLVKPEEKQASLDYVFKNDLVDAVTIGMLKVEEVDDALKHMAAVTG